MKPSIRVAAAAAVLFGSTLHAQCANVWLPGDPLPGPNAQVRALTMWDPDGAGPLTPRLVVGGMFDVAGGAVTDRIGAWDPAGNTWQAFGSPTVIPPASIEAVHTLPNGDLIAGGNYGYGYPPTASFGYLARWNGSAWSAIDMGSQFGVIARAVTSLTNGDIIVGGDFMQVGGVAARCVARWDGVSWSPLGQVASMAIVNALLTMPNGDVLVGGQFLQQGASAYQAVRRWNGTAWSDLGPGVAGLANALALLPNGDVVAGGSFTLGGGVHGVARWNGTTWAPLGGPVTSEGGVVNSLCVLPNGDVIVGGVFTSIGGTPAINVARWNGASWSAMAGGAHHPTPTVSSLARLPNGDLVAGIFSAYPVQRHYLLRWNGAAWSALSTGNDGAVLALTKLSNGDVVAGGAFTTIGGTSANHVARRNGTAWSPLGAGIAGDVLALAARPGGGVVAGGSFTQAGGVAANNIASWDGFAWSPLGAGTNGPVHGLVVLGNGDIVAVGAFWMAGTAVAGRVARWNGSAWTALGGGFGDGFANAAAVLPNGDLVVGGKAQFAGGVFVNNIARWNGTSWFPLGGGISGWAPLTEVRAMLVHGSDLVVSGYFTDAGGIAVNGIASWNGTSWSAMGSASSLGAAALTTLPNGDLVANQSRWDGEEWTPLASTGPGPEIRAMVKGPGDTLLLGGSFVVVGSVSGYAVSAYVAELTTTCPATVIPVGASCASSAGPMALAANSLPWLGSTFTATATGMPASSIALAVTGFGTASLPLASILPQGGAGCFLWTTPDFVAAALPSAGSVSTQLAIPGQPALIGQVFHHQVVPVELAPTGGLLAVTSTNRLTALIGIF